MKSILHPAFVFQHESQVENSGSLAIRDIGNATNESDTTFQFWLRSKKEIPSQFSSLPNVPFQVQIKYTKMDGMKCLRVVTVMRNITKDRQIAEKNLNVSVIGLNSVQQAAKMALQGNYEQAYEYLSAVKVTSTRIYSELL